MQIIQSIKDRGGLIIVISIAISLIGLIFLESRSGSNKESLTSASIGKVNGESIDKSDFERRVKAEESKQAQRTGQQPTGVELLKLRDQVWNQIVAENVFYKEAEKLGITLSPKELSYILQSDDQQNPLKQERSLLGADGRLDQSKLADALKNIKKAKGEQRDAVDMQIIEPLKLSTSAAKYTGMLNASAYYPRWMQEKDANEAKNFANISYVAVQYNEIPDSTITVKDEDINGYVAKRKNLFKQEAGVTLSYIAFSQLPTATDSTAAKKQVENLRLSFATDTSAKLFLARNTSALEYKDEYLPFSRINSKQKDTIIKQPVGSVYGPYVEADNYAIAKIIGTKQLPDSVKARHILIALNDRESGKQIMADSVGSKLADSILSAVKSGADFAALAIKYSSDPGSKIKGGDLGTFGYGQMVAEFNDVCFNKPAGTKEKVKTQFGYRIIDVQSQTNFKTAYKIAILAKPILASDETFNAATQAATKAAINKNSKSLNEYASKTGLKVIDVPNTIKENDFTVGNMQDARSLVKWAFGAKVGDVSDPIAIGDNQIVATINKMYTEGTQDAATARPMAEAAVRNQKKAEIITAKLNSATTLEAAATLYNKQVLTAGADSSITMNGKIINGIGVEPKVIGAAFNKENQTKASPAIAGTSGVYMIKVNNIASKADEAPEKVAAQIVSKTTKIRGQTNNWFEALKKQSDIKDNRSKFY